MYGGGGDEKKHNVVRPPLGIITFYNYNKPYKGQHTTICVLGL
jgi:hypothetical protein